MGPSAGPDVEEMKAKVALVGASGVGKSSLVRRYVLNEFDEKYRMTLGVIVYKRTAYVTSNERTSKVTVTVWDTMGDAGGTDPLRNIDLYGAQGILAVCDVTDARTVPALRRRVDDAFAAAGDVPVQILLNKSDLGPRENAKTAGLRTGLDRGVPCYLTSAKEGDNVVAAFEDLARRIVERTLVPLSGPFDTVDQGILVRCSSAARTPEGIARRLRLPVILAEARLERLRRRGFLRVAALGLNAAGRPRVSYARTDAPFTEPVRERLVTEP